MSTFHVYGGSLAHHGIKGQKWGEKNGPPYPLTGGSYSREELRYKRASKKVYGKKHVDKTIKKGESIATLSYNPNRTQNTDMFYGAYDKWDKHQYNALFNKKAPQDIFDENGEKIGTGEFYKYRINNVAKSNIKVASEDSGRDAFLKLYSTNRDFANFVRDENRMESFFDSTRYRFKGYREARDAVKRIRETDSPKESDLRTAYRMFNYIIPSDGGGNANRAKDVATQRAKLFKELKKSGYGAVLDTNDSLYGGFHANAPVIVFDTNTIDLFDVSRVSTIDHRFSELAFVGYKTIGGII